ncbi:MAG: hypothetical protein ACK5H2_12035 [Beutenbergiaceae bacterium]
MTACSPTEQAIAPIATCDLLPISEVSALLDREQPEMYGSLFELDGEGGANRCTAGSGYDPNKLLVVITEADRIEQNDRENYFSRCATVVPLPTDMDARGETCIISDPTPFGSEHKLVAIWDDIAIGLHLVRERDVIDTDPADLAAIADQMHSAVVERS